MKTLDERIHNRLLRTTPCPDCHSKKLYANRLLFAPFAQYKRAPHKWYIECQICHYCGVTKWTLHRAIKAWEKEGKAK